MLCIYVAMQEAAMPDENDATLPPTRLPRALLDAAKAQARRRDETLSQVVRRALRAYVASAPAQADLEDAITAASPKRQRRSGTRGG
jgi:beta-glucosidase-like glycosyl hydrolase